MELLLTLRKIEMLEKVLPFVDGIICGKYFTSAYRFSLEELSSIRRYCRKMGKKFYIVMDNFISEDEKMLMYEYLDFIDSLDVDGIRDQDELVFSFSLSQYIGCIFVHMDAVTDAFRISIVKIHRSTDDTRLPVMETLHAVIGM